MRGQNVIFIIEAFFCFKHNYHVYVNFYDGYANTAIVAVLMYTSCHVNRYETSKNVYALKRGNVEINVIHGKKKLLQLHFMTQIAQLLRRKLN